MRSRGSFKQNLTTEMCEPPSVGQQTEASASLGRAALDGCPGIRSGDPGGASRVRGGGGGGGREEGPLEEVLGGHRSRIHEGLGGEPRRRRRRRGCWPVASQARREEGSVDAAECSFDASVASMQSRFGARDAFALVGCHTAACRRLWSPFPRTAACFEDSQRMCRSPVLSTSTPGSFSFVSVLESSLLCFQISGAGGSQSPGNGRRPAQPWIGTIWECGTSCRRECGKEEPQNQISGTIVSQDQ